MIEVPTIAAAFAAGLLSFLSPCVLPLIPSYVTFITGMSLDELTGADAERKGVRRAVLVHGLLFVSGFTLIFVLVGASLGYVSVMLIVYTRWIEIIGGVLLIALGFYLLGLLRIPGASREWRLHLGTKPLGYLGTVGVGVAFGAGWTPCFGPVISGVLTLAGTSGSAAAGMRLLLVYSAGLAIPLLAAALLLERFMRTAKRISPYLQWVSRASGALLILLGILLATGSFTILAAYLNNFTPAFLFERL